MYFISNNCVMIQIGEIVKDQTVIQTQAPWISCHAGALPTEVSGAGIWTSLTYCLVIPSCLNEEPWRSPSPSSFPWQELTCLFQGLAMWLDGRNNNKTRIQTLVPWITSQVLYSLSYLALVFQPVWLSPPLNDVHPRRPCMHHTITIA